MTLPPFLGHGASERSCNNPELLETLVTPDPMSAWQLMISEQ